MSRKSLSLYLHIPFCAARCSYCDFNIYTGLEKLVPAFTQALVREVEGWGVALGHPPVRTLYVGGGTPSLLPLPELEAILRACSKSFTLDSSVEVSLEANPDDLTRQHAEGLLALGVSRLSIGMQTFDDALLRRLGRTHTGEEAKRAFVAAREAGHRNINLDLIYGLPGQDLPAWQLALEQALEMGPEHLSLYGLTVEEGTPLWRQVDRGKVSAPDPDVAAEMYELAQGVLGGAGYQQYEISNWSRPGYESQHNLTYWRYEPYLGFGPGAYSCFDGFRFSVINFPQEYVRWLMDRPLPGQLETGITEAGLRTLSPLGYVESLSLARQRAEKLILGLRLVRDGLDMGAYQERFGSGALDAFEPVLKELEEFGLLKRSTAPHSLRLTNRGLLLSNEVFWRLLPSEELSETSGLSEGDNRSTTRPAAARG